MVEELEAREQAFKKARVGKQKEEVELWQETERIKEQGRRLREDKEREMRQRGEEQSRATGDAAEDDLEAPSLGMVLVALREFGVSLTMSHRSPGYNHPHQIYPQDTSQPYDS